MVLLYFLINWDDLIKIYLNFLEGLFISSEWKFEWPPIVASATQGGKTSGGSAVSRETSQVPRPVRLRRAKLSVTVRPKLKAHGRRAREGASTARKKRTLERMKARRGSGCRIGHKPKRLPTDFPREQSPEGDGWFTGPTPRGKRTRRRGIALGKGKPLKVATPGVPSG
jgi:hypothetical protein